MLGALVDGWMKVLVDLLDGLPSMPAKDLGLEPVFVCVQIVLDM